MLSAATRGGLPNSADMCCPYQTVLARAGSVEQARADTCWPYQTVRARAGCIKQARADACWRYGNSTGTC